MTWFTGTNVLAPIDYGFIGAYLVGIMILGLWLERKARDNIDAYFLGNRSLPWWALGASGMSSNTDIAGTMVITALIYSLGVKGFFIEIRGGVVLPPEFLVSVPDGKGGFEAVQTTLAEWSAVMPPLTIDMPGDYSRYNMFGITIFFYLVKTCVEGFAGAGGYTSQRYFAARTDREAGLLSLFWILLLSFRWPLVTGLAMLGIHYGMTTGKVIDPELVLPTVIAEYMPVGMKGIVIACFMAAAMSTFTAVINAGAAYWVKDIYQTFINPKASNATLVWHSRISTVAIVLLGLAFSLDSVNINDIWGWITMAFGTGLFVPLLLRWYWWRYNGYGFALGTLFGMLSAILIRVLKVELSESMSFVVPSVISLVGCVAGSLLTAPTSRETLLNFVKVTRPFGFWGPIVKQLSRADQDAIRDETRRDLAAIAFAVPWQLVLFLMGMVFVLRQWSVFAGLLTAFVVLSAGVYWFWFRHLGTDETARETVS